MPDINSLACGLSSQRRESVERRFVPQVAHFGDIGDEMSVPAANDNELAAEWPQVTTVSDLSKLGCALASFLRLTPSAKIHFQSPIGSGASNVEQLP